MDALNDILGVDGTRVLNVNINKFSRNTKIQVIIDNKNGITVDECAKVSRITEDVIKLDDEFKNNCSDRVKQLLGLNYKYPKIMDVSKTVNDIGLGYKAK